VLLLMYNNRPQFESNTGVLYVDLVSSSHEKSARNARRVQEMDNVESMA